MKVNVGNFIIDDEIKSLVLNTLNSGRISEGIKTKQFENDFAKYIGVKYSTAVNSGTSALVAALLALKYSNKYSKLKPGSKVITTPLTYIATSNAIVMSGMTPIYADVDKRSFVITPDSILKLIQEHGSENISGIVPVHLMGNPCDMDAINEIAKQYDLFVLEDSCQAHGTLYKNKKVGSLSDVSVYSFYIAHNIQVGEMGAVVTNDLNINNLVKQIKANGRLCSCPVCTRQSGICPNDDKDDTTDFDPRFMHEYIGLNFKTMDIQATIGLTQLSKADEIFKIRKRNVKFLNDNLKILEPYIKLPKYSEDISYLAYTITIDDLSKINRKTLRKKLESFGIESRPLFGCIPLHQPAYKEYKNMYQGKLPVAEYLGNNSFYIGCHQYLDQEMLNHIIQAFMTIFSEI